MRLVWIIAVFLGGCSLFTPTTEPYWARELDHAQSDAEIRDAMRRISGGVEPSDIGGRLNSLPDVEKRARITKAMVARFDLVPQYDIDQLNGTKRFVFRENDVLILHVTYDEISPSFRAYATIASGNRNLAHEILAFIASELEQ